MQKPGLSVRIYMQSVHQNKSSNFDYLLSGSLQKAHQYSQTAEKGFYYFVCVCFSKVFITLPLCVEQVNSLSVHFLPKTFTFFVRVIKITKPNHQKIAVLRKTNMIHLSQEHCLAILKNKFLLHVILTKYMIYKFNISYIW